MRKFLVLVGVLLLLMPAILIMGCDEAMLEEMLEAEGFDAARWDELEDELKAIESYVERITQALPPEDRQAFEDRLDEKMEEKFGEIEADMDARMEAIEAEIDEKLEKEEITEIEAFGLMMEAMVGFYIEMLEFMETAVIYMQDVLDELIEEFNIDVSAIPKPVIPTRTIITMTIDEPLAMVNAQEYMLDQAPLIQEGRTLVPLRFIGEALGASVEWDGESNTVTCTTPETQILLTIDNPIAYVNGNPVEIDVPPTIVNGRTLVPMRFISESMGFQVDWLSETRQIVITSGP